MNTYRVWFSDGSACLQDAPDEQTATRQACPQDAFDERQSFDSPINFDNIVVVDRVELLT